MSAEFSEEVIGVPQREFHEELGARVDPSVSDFENYKRGVLDTLRREGMTEQADIIEKIIERRIAIAIVLEQLKSLAQSTGTSLPGINAQIAELESPRLSSDTPPGQVIFPSVELFISEDGILNIVFTTLTKKAETRDGRTIPVTGVRQLAVNRYYFSAAQEVTTQEGVRPVIRDKTVGLRIPYTDLKPGVRKKTQVWARAAGEDKIPTKITPDPQDREPGYRLAVQVDNPRFALSDTGENPSPVTRQARDNEREPLLTIPETTTTEGTLLRLLQEFRDKFMAATKDMESKTPTAPALP